MAFSVRNPAVERKARAFAARHGTSLTGALELALDTASNVEDQEREAEYRKWKAVLTDLQAAYAEARPSGLTEQDIMGWDENGLPT